MNERREIGKEFSGAIVAIVVLGILVVIILGLWQGPVTALLVTTGLGLVAVALLVLMAMRRESAEAPHSAPPDDGNHRILVVADESCTSEGFVSGLRSHAGERKASVFVVAPALESRLGFLTDDQRGYDDATRRLDIMMKALGRAGITARGEVGSSDPLQAADDGLRQFPANEIVFVTHPAGQAKWLEDGLVDRAKARFEEPVSHLSVAGAG